MTNEVNINYARVDPYLSRIYNETLSFYVKKFNNYNAHGGVNVEEIQTKINQFFHEFMNKDDILGFRVLVEYAWDRNFWSNFGPLSESSYDDLVVCEIGFKTDSLNHTVTIGDFLTNHEFITVNLEFGVH